MTPREEKRGEKEKKTTETLGKEEKKSATSTARGCFWTARLNKKKKREKRGTAPKRGSEKKEKQRIRSRSRSSISAWTITGKRGSVKKAPSRERGPKKQGKGRGKERRTRKYPREESFVPSNKKGIKTKRSSINSLIGIRRRTENQKRHSRTPIRGGVGLLL